MSLITTIASPITFAIPITWPRLVRSENQYLSQIKNNVRFRPVGHKPLRLTCFSRSRHSLTFAGLKPIRLTRASGARHASLICAAALDATSAAEQTQTQTVTRKSSTITAAPIKGKEKPPKLDDGGAGLPPRDGGGGGGGGGGGDSGGFFLFSFLLFIDFLKEDENKGAYADEPTPRFNHLAF